MPSNIPYDPALALGHLVSKERLTMLQQIAAAQAPADTAQDRLNSLIAAKHSLDMTSHELARMGIDMTKLNAERAALDRSISEAAESCARAKIKAVKDTQSLHATMEGISESAESPIDDHRSQIRQMPLTADALRLHAQYFSFDANSQDAGAHASNVANFINGQVTHMGSAFAVQALSSASQVHRHARNHRITGTLVIAITCMHKDAALFAPLIIDVDKGIRAFNACFPDATIKTGSLSAMRKIAASAGTREEAALTIVSGATLGSCFVGMVHVLNQDTAQVNAAMESIASSLQTQFTTRSLFISAAGIDGARYSFGDDAKSLLSSQHIVSQCTQTTIGSIPPATSSQRNMGTLTLLGPDAPESTKAQPLQDVRQRAQGPIAPVGSDAPAGQRVAATTSGRRQSTCLEIEDIEDGTDSTIDINAMMEALDDYLQKCQDGKIGSPITYYTQPITADQLAQHWIEKYHPAGQ